MEQLAPFLIPLAVLVILKLAFRPFPENDGSMSQEYEEQAAARDAAQYIIEMQRYAELTRCRAAGTVYTRLPEKARS